MPTFSSNALQYRPDYSPEFVDRLKEIFVNNRFLTEGELSRMSEKWLGQHVSLDIVRRLVIDGGWQALRNAAAGDSADIAEEVNQIRRIVYEQIAYASQVGYLVVGEASYDEIAARLEGLNVRIAEVNQVDPQLVNAYMNLLAKSKMDINLTTASAKTARQQAIEASREAIALIQAERNGY